MTRNPRREASSSNIYLWLLGVAFCSTVATNVGAQPAPAATAAKPTTPGNAAVAPTISPPTANATPPAAATVTTPDAPKVENLLTKTLAVQPGGLSADEVARRAQMASPAVRAKQEAYRGAEQKVREARLMFVPQVKVLARYVRLSDVGAANLSDQGYLVGAQDPGPVTVYCPPPAALGGLPPDQPVQCTAAAAGVSVSFPVVLNMWTLQGTLAIPLSDYLLRMSQNLAASQHSQAAAQLQVRAEQAKARLEARLAFYNWVRAKGGVVVAQQGLDTVQAHHRDVKAVFQVGSASRADVMAVEGQVAKTELLVENSRNMLQLADEALHVMLSDPPEKHYAIGEDVFAPLPKLPEQRLHDMFREATSKRLEVQILTRTVRSLEETRKVVNAGNYPRLDAFGNAYYQNPNPRVFPQQEKWRSSWDVGIQLSWTVNDMLTTSSKSAQLSAKVAELKSQQRNLENGIRLQVTKAYMDVRRTDVALDTSQRRLKSAEESYRVRRELFRVGRATSTELTDAETALLSSRFDALNAKIDARIARANLDHAMGRDLSR